MKKAIASGNTHKSISKEESAEGAIAFTYNMLPRIDDRSRESTTDPDAHYLKLDKSKFDGLEQFTIQIDFELDFEIDYSKSESESQSGRDKNCHHMKQAYLLSLGYELDDGTVWDNMLSVYLKAEDITDDSKCNDFDHWDLSVVLEDHLHSKPDRYIFKAKNWIKQGRE